MKVEYVLSAEKNKLAINFRLEDKKENLEKIKKDIERQDLNLLILDKRTDLFFHNDGLVIKYLTDGVFDCELNNLVKAFKERNIELNRWSKWYIKEPIIYMQD